MNEEKFGAKKLLRMEKKKKKLGALLMISNLKDEDRVVSYLSSYLFKTLY